MILNEYSKTAWLNGASPDINKANLDNLEQGVYDVTAKAMELAAYEINAAASATAASASAVSAAASAAVYTDLAQDVANHATYSTTEEVVVGTFDGKPLYRKALLIPALSSIAGTTTYNHEIANIDYILKYHSMYTNGTNFYQEENITAAISTNVTKTFVAIGINTNRSSYSGKVFIEYTKTTD